MSIPDGDQLTEKITINGENSVIAGACQQIATNPAPREAPLPLTPSTLTTASRR